ncbi:hypothetical protein [Actinomadura litoris]|uniref:hypothetical protein n=1 Tax=Actinomadura litoris TaxID=2678616 RepID=UPI001FA6DA84|nr:hypothetical protein [Actinomadura litoris]
MRDPHRREIRGRVHVIETEVPEGVIPPSTSMTPPAPEAPTEAMECRGWRECPSYGIRRLVPLQRLADGVLARPVAICAYCRMEMYRIPEDADA